MSAEPSEYYQRCAKMVEELRAMLGHGYGEGDFEHMTSIIKARNAQWDKLERDFHGEVTRQVQEIKEVSDRLSHQSGRP
jgi:hypothetical protein